jgi:hypothetical protein
MRRYAYTAGEHLGDLKAIMSGRIIPRLFNRILWRYATRIIKRYTR